MDAQPKQAVGEIGSLQGFTNDLIGIQALAAVWVGCEPFQIAGTLLDVLVRVLQLDFAYARMGDSTGDPPVEVVRLARRGDQSVQPREVGRALDSWLAGKSYTTPFVVPNPVGEGEVSIGIFRFGLQDGIGVLVAGSRRPEFPAMTDTLLLQVAANQAAVGLQEARILSAQRRASQELERRVVERTGQLAATNEELRKEIIERKRAEEALRASEERFRRYFELGLIGMAITSPTKGCVEVNDELCRILGYEREELLKKSWAEMTHPDDLAADVERFNRVVTGEIDGYTIDKRWIRKDGRVIHTIMAAQCVRRPGGSVDYFVGLVQDVTERKLGEQALRQAQEELAHVARVTSMGELAASIAHEVNQPLAAVVANGHACARWLAVDTPNVGEAVEAAQRVVRDANRAAEVVARIRAFVKRGALQRAVLDLDEVTREVIGMAQGEISARGVLLSVAPAAGLPLVLGDRIQLQQVILNLVMNAVEAMSTVRDRLRTLEMAVVRHGADALCVSVRDSGVGLDPAHRDRVFDAFHTTKPEGMGMGLAISRSIVEAHGGRLWATANRRAGETFQFTVPLVAPAAS
jgi:PAS domain S-box-containing protein